MLIILSLQTFQFYINILYMENFIHFGCWNNLNKNGNLKPVMDKLQSRLNNPDLPEIDFISVAGDNYYPDKLKPKIKTDGKKKIIKPDLLEMGFDMLPSEPDIYMILGNHDLETNTNPKKPTLFIRDENTPEDNCKILTIEQELSENAKNIEFVMNKELFLSSGTLVLMIDTSMYTMDAKKYLKCYNKFFNTDDDITEIQRKQNDWIISTIKENLDNIKHLVLIGHHPISGIKYKKNNEDKLNDIPLFIDVLQEIYALLSNNVYYYFLCADLHLYQKGFVYVEEKKERSDSISKDLNIIPNTMIIEQHIVGTGGTELDDALPSQVDEYFDNDRVSYLFDKSIHSNGFLECNINKDVLNFEFHSADQNIELAGVKSKKTTRRKKKKNKRKFSTQKNKKKRKKTKNK